MDLIYTSAELTLNAAAGDDFSFGLPGVCSKRRVRYRDAVVGNMCVSYVLTNVFQSIARSRWFTRGWTFQEGYLPPRRLYFTDSAVLFFCNQVQGHDGFQRYPSESEVYRLGGTLNSQVLGARSDGHSGPSEVMRLLEQNSARKLSYDYDALNAIRGVLNYHRSKKQSTETMWDIPHRLSLAWQHTICINWKHLSTAIRRPEHTNRSTLGRDDRVELANILHQYQISADTTSDHLDGFENIDFLEDPQYIRITVKIYRFPVVNIVPSTREQMGDYFCEAQGAYPVLPNFGFEGIGGEIKLYMHVQ